MTIQQLHYVITIADAGSFNKAAELLYIAQPSLTSAVQNLEKEIGITIFHRSGHGVALTNDGMEFINYARQVYTPYETLTRKYSGKGSVKKKFGISTQHYSFVVKSFVEAAKKLDTSDYEFAIRETKTREVIEDVNLMRSEIGVIYLCDFNRKVLLKLLKSNDLVFHKLIECSAYVYLWKDHPLADRSSLTLEALTDYPALTFEQGSGSSFYFAEELLSTNEYPRTIKATDRATMLNLMIGLNGYTLCSGIICEELNGSDYKAIPLDLGEQNAENRMEIGYITKKNIVPDEMTERLIEEMRRYLSPHAQAD